MHSRSRMKLDFSRFHHTGARSTRGFHRPGRHRVPQARSRREMVGESRERAGCTLLRIACEAGFGNVVRTFFLAYRMSASSESVCFLACPLPETALRMLRNLLVGALPYTWYTLRLINALRGVNVLRSAQYGLTRSPFGLPPET